MASSPASCQGGENASVGSRTGAVPVGVAYRGHRFPPEVISRAVWLYYRFGLSFRDVEDLLAERGVIVTYEAIRRWCLTFGLDYARRLRSARFRQIAIVRLCQPAQRPPSSLGHGRQLRV